MTSRNDRLSITLALAAMNESVKACAACKRALAREQAALAEKKRGMK